LRVAAVGNVADGALFVEAVDLVFLVFFEHPEVAAGLRDVECLGALDAGDALCLVGLDGILSIAVGGAGLLEDADELFALEVISVSDCQRRPNGRLGGGAVDGDVRCR